MCEGEEVGNLLVVLGSPEVGWEVCLILFPGPPITTFLDGLRREGGWKEGERESNRGIR